MIRLERSDVRIDGCVMLDQNVECEVIINKIRE